MSTRFSPKFKAEALRLLSVGVTTRDAQAQLKRRFKKHVGEGTLRLWAKMAEAAEEEDVPAPAPTPEPDAPADDADLYEQTRQQLTDARRRAKEAATDGNHAAAVRFQGEGVKLSQLLARLEKSRKVDTDVVTVPRDEFDAAVRQASGYLAALRSDVERTGGLVCSKCGAEIRIALAKGEKP